MLIWSLSKTLRSKLCPSTTLLQSVELCWSMSAANLNIQAQLSLPSQKVPKFSLASLEVLCASHQAHSISICGTCSCYVRCVVVTVIRNFGTKTGGKAASSAPRPRWFSWVWARLVQLPAQCCWYFPGKVIPLQILNFRLSRVSGKMNSPGAWHTRFNVQINKYLMTSVLHSSRYLSINYTIPRFSLPAFVFLCAHC